MSTSGGTSSAKAEELARRFEQINAEVIAFVESCDEATWKTTCPGEERPIGAVAAHVANAYGPVAGWVHSVATGQPVNITMDEIHAYNAQAAVADSARSQAEVAEALRRNGAKAAESIRTLSDEQLAQTAHVGPAGAPLSAEQVAKYVLLRHPRDHLASMRGGTTGNG